MFQPLVRGTELEVHTVMHLESEHRLVPVLLIGTTDPEIARTLREHGVGVIDTGRVDRALRLLKNFKVAVVICDADIAERIPELIATGTSVIVLGEGNDDWNGIAVTTLPRSAPAASIAAAVHRCAGESAAA